MKLRVQVAILAQALAFCVSCEQPKKPSPEIAPPVISDGTTLRQIPIPAPMAEPSPEPKRDKCPNQMAEVPEGEFWVGTEREVFDREENPQFLAKVASFCVDRLEVSTHDYETCVSEGKCTPARGKSSTCNSVKKGRGDHPINCIDHEQARAVCGARNARLLTEVEWEYIARGGAEMRAFSWGTAHPDGNTCWKQPGTCMRGSYAEEAFGLHDVTGNVWEWTDSWFGAYPWPAQTGRHKVYRGGGWSRRFEKWLRPTLRNRLDPTESGSHLGTRCATTPAHVSCPGGSTRTSAGGCHHAILQVKCLDGHVWNGVRCAREGDSERCAKPAEEVAGFGCVTKPIVGKTEHTLDLHAVSRARSPEFDADCVTNNAARPKAYRYTGAGHVERNMVGKTHGCKNRDVGVGFNSACCPD